MPFEQRPDDRRIRPAAGSSAADADACCRLRKAISGLRGSTADFGFSTPRMRTLSGRLRRAPRYAAAHEEMARMWREWGFADKALGYAYRAVYLRPAVGKRAQHARHGARRAGTDRRRTIGVCGGARARAVVRLGIEQLMRPGVRSWGIWRLRADTARPPLRAEPQLVAAHNNLALTFAAAGQMNARARGVPRRR